MAAPPMSKLESFNPFPARIYGVQVNMQSHDDRDAEIMRHALIWLEGVPYKAKNFVLACIGLPMLDRLHIAGVP
jgi:hypothetical protein